MREFMQQNEARSGSGHLPMRFDKWRKGLCIWRAYSAFVVVPGLFSGCRSMYTEVEG